jgi:ankyrin
MENFLKHAPTIHFSKKRTPKAWTFGFLRQSCIARFVLRTASWSLERGVALELHEFLTASTPLAIAAESGNLTTVELLVQKGAKLRANNVDNDSFIKATLSGNEEMILYLFKQKLEDRAEAFEAFEALLGQALIHAAKMGRASTVALLLSNNADSLSDHTKAELATQALIEAAHAGHISVAKVLLGFGANPTGTAYRTPLQSAAQSGDCAMISFLLGEWSKA